jgi:hypothetical protein
LWFQSEESGYSHLYLADVTTGKKQALTSGKYEVQSVRFRAIKNSFISLQTKYTRAKNIFINFQLAGGKAEKLTTMTGAHEVTIAR